MKKVITLIVTLLLAFCIVPTMLANLTITDFNGVGSDVVEVYYRGAPGNPVGSYFDGTVELFFEQSGDKVTVKAIPADYTEVFTLIIAVYDSDGVLVFVSASEQFVGSGELTLDVGDYPLGEYSYKAFCWDMDYIPLFEAAAIEQ